MWNRESSPTLANCTFRANVGGGGGVYNTQSTFRADNCSFFDNADSGMWNDQSNVSLRNCIFRSNAFAMFYGCGGGIWSRTTELNLMNCVFADNWADWHGGALSMYGCDANILNCTFIGNQAPQGSAIECLDGGSDVQVTNCILWDDGNEACKSDDSVVCISYSDVRGGWPGEGNIDADPCFALPGDFHLLAGSASIDAGTNTPAGGLPPTDIHGSPRCVDGDGDGSAVVDMGAQEYDPAGPIIVVSPHDFSYTKGYPPSTQTLQIRNAGGGTLSWYVVGECQWLEVWPQQGVSSGQIDEVQLRVDPNYDVVGHHNCALRVVADSALNSPVTIGISLYVPKTIHVPSEYATIQAAIDAAQDFETVMIAPGTYTGDGNRDLDFKGKRITVRSIDPTDPNIVAATIIDCNGSWQDPHRGFYFHSEEDANSVIDSLTVTNGFAPFAGGAGIYCRAGGFPVPNPGPGPTIRNCIITGNKTFGDGGGIFGSSGPIVNCTVTGNMAVWGAGLAYCSGPISNCVISGNKGSGLSGCSGPITNCIIRRNIGGGLSMCSGPIANCTVSGNKGYGLAYSWGGSATSITNSIFWDNKTDSAAQIGSLKNLSVSYCDIQGGQEGITLASDSTLIWGPGNIDDDPLVTPDGHLQIDSPCINLGDPNGDYSGQRDVDGEPRVAGGRVDIGADEYIDMDSDGLPDWWERKYFGEPNGADPNANPDGDEYTNLEEYKISSNPVWSEIYYVDCNRPDDSGDGLSWETAKRTIQAAIDQASDSDRVVVAEGVYTGKGNRDLDYGGKFITVRSKDPTDPNTVACTIIDCNGSKSEYHRGFKFVNLEGRYSVVAGLTITNGYSDHGAAALCLWSSPTIKRCNITGNIAEYTGGAIDCNGCDPMISDCNISGNSSGAAGGGICCCNNSSAAITHCSISGNSSTKYGGAIYCPNSTPTIHNCAITYNQSGWYGGAICGSWSGYSWPHISNCTITANSAQWGGGAGAFHDGELSNCIISGNTAPDCGDFYDCDVGLTNCTIVGNTFRSLRKCQAELTNCIAWDNRPFLGAHLRYYCCLQGGNTDNGCINCDPCFVVPGYWDLNGTPYDPWDDFWVDGDYHLLPGSPCVDAGDPNFPEGPDQTDIDGQPRILGGRVDIGADEYLTMIRVEMKFTPQTLNPTSHGRWLKAHFVLPEEFTIDDVDAGSPAKITEPFEPDIESEYMKVFVNQAGLVAVEAAFARAEFCAGGIDGNDVEVTVTGSLTTGQLFYGTDTISIASSYLKYLADLASYWLRGDCDKPDWCGGLDLDRNSVVNFVDFALSDGCCIEISVK